MDPNVYQLTFPAFIIILGGLVWFFVSRQIRKSDEADADWKKEDALWKKDAEKRADAGDRDREALRLALADKLNREELDKMFAEIRRVETAVGDRLDKFLTAMVVNHQPRQ